MLTTLAAQIEQAFQGEGNDWRTLEGIAREIRQPVDVVRDFIARHPDRFQAAPLMIGDIALYALVDRKQAQ